MARWTSVVALATLALVTGCSQTQPTSAASGSSALAPGTLVLGAIYPLTGSQATGGREELAGVRTALDLAQRQGLTRDRPVKLQVISATTPEDAVRAVDTLIDHYHVPAIIGTYGSTLAEPAAARADERHVVYWETGAVADPVTIGHSYVFRTVATGSTLGREAADFTNDVLLPRAGLLPAQARVVIAAVDDVYGRSVADAEVARAAEHGLTVTDRIDYDPHRLDATALAVRLAADRPDYLWDVSYVDDGIALWRAIEAQPVRLRAAVGTSSAFCMPQFGRALGAQAVGLYAADKPDQSDVRPSLLAGPARSLLAAAVSAYERQSGGTAMSIPAVAGFVGGWALFHGVLPSVAGPVTPDALRTAAYGLDEPAYTSINGGGVRFAPAGSPDAGQNVLAPAVVGQWQAVNTMRVVYPAPFAVASPITG